MSDTIASTIMQQLGGWRFKVMTGASAMVDTGTGLAFVLPHDVSPNINRVIITLNVMDLYDVQFFKVRGADVKLVAEHNDVYWDCLQQVFTAATGLDCSL